MNVLMIVSGDYTKDPRVLREKECLEQKGFKVDVADWKRKHYNNNFFTLFNLIFWQLNIIKQYKESDYDFVHCHDFDTLFIGVFLKKRIGCTLIYDSHEMYALMTNIWLVLPFEKLLLSNVDKCIGVSEPVLFYLEYLGAKNINVVHNCKPLQDIKKRVNGSENLVVSYFGTLSRLRMFPEIVDIMGSIQDVDFIIGGYGPLYNEVENRCSRYDNISFQGFVSEQKVMQYTSFSDIVLCMLNPDNHNCRYGMPNKFFECLVLGKPILVTKDTYIGDLVKNQMLGFTVDYDSDSIVSFFKNIDKSMCKEIGGNALFLAENCFNWECEQQYLLEVYN